MFYFSWLIYTSIQRLDYGWNEIIFLFSKDILNLSDVTINTFTRWCKIVPKYAKPFSQVNFS